MEEVERADRTRDRDEVELILSRKKNGDLADSVILEVYPEIGCAWTAVLVVGADHVLPASRMVLLADGAKKLRIIRPRPRETVAVDGDAVHACDYAAQVFVVLVCLGCQYQHRVVQGELGSRRGI